jgi:hypothetical protein
MPPKHKLSPIWSERPTIDQAVLDLHFEEQPADFRKQFQTPVAVCKYMVDMVPAGAVSILEPTPGIGNIVRELQGGGVPYNRASRFLFTRSQPAVRLRGDEPTFFHAARFHGKRASQFFRGWYAPGLSCAYGVYEDERRANCAHALVHDIRFRRAPAASEKVWVEIFDGVTSQDFQVRSRSNGGYSTKSRVPRRNCI